MPTVVRSPLARAIGVLVATAALLSGCSSSFQSPAAVVGGDRITQDELARMVVIDKALSNQQGVAADSQAGKTFARQVLSSLIQERVVNRYAAAHGISVTATDVDQQVQTTVTQVGGQPQLDRILAQRKLALGDLRGAISRGLLLQRVQTAVATEVGHLGASATQAQKDQVFTRWLRDQLRALKVSVNPRFGRFDLSSGQIRPITSTAT